MKNIDITTPVMITLFAISLCVSCCYATRLRQEIEHRKQQHYIDSLIIDNRDSAIVKCKEAYDNKVIPITKMEILYKSGKPLYRQPDTISNE